MKHHQILFLSLIAINFLSLSLELEPLGELTFGNDNENIVIDGSDIYQITGNFDTSKKYLYIYPLYVKGKDTINKGVYKIYFKEFSNSDLNTDANYLQSDFSTIEVNSELFIEIEQLHYKSKKASIYFVVYGKCTFVPKFEYADSVNFPKYNSKMNFQIAQFTLPKKKNNFEIAYDLRNLYNDALTILSKTSLKNIDIQVVYNKKDVTKEKLANIYPNGYSIFLDRNYFDTHIDLFVRVFIKKKIDQDEIIVLGYNHYNKENLFPLPIKNGFQLYLDGNSSHLKPLTNSGEKTLYDQFFIYQSSSKNLKFQFLHSDGSTDLAHYINEYSNMAHLNVDSTGQLDLDFSKTPLRTGLYFQYIDYNEPEIAQKVLQPLVTGVPKSMLIPQGKSMFHYLPIKKESKNLNYYLRFKNSQNMKAYFTSCTNYPGDCPNIESLTQNYPIIDNIGLWYSITANNSEVQLIYINCEKECSYDILMTYDNDPLFLFPENNYTKFISNKGEDTFILPVFEYFNLTQTDFINIDLTIINGKAELILQNLQTLKEISKYEFKAVGNKKSYSIPKDQFLNADYFKKEILVTVKQVKNYKNTLYNLMYQTGVSKNKLLANNLVNIELLKVADSTDVESETKIFNFVNYKDEDLYISISTQLCQMKITIDDTKSETGYSYSNKVSKGNHKYAIYLMNDDGGICNKGFEEEVMLFAYHDKANIILSQNTLIKSTFSTETISFNHLFKFDNNENEDKSFNIEIEKLSGDDLNYYYKLERISLNTSQTNNFDSPVQPIISKKASFISSSQINEYCGNLNDNEVCSLTIIFTSDSKGATFGLFLNQNGHYNARHLGNEALINSITPDNVRFYYIDLNKNYDTEILINSYGQDLEYSISSLITKQTDEDKILASLTSFSSGSNYHIISINNDKECDTLCRLYIGVRVSENTKLKRVPTTFSINYLFKESNNIKSEIEIPLNYFVQYKFNDLNEIKYSINILQKSSVVLELYTIKENESDDSEITASISQKGGTKEELQPEEKIFKELDAGNYEIIINNPKEENKPLYKLRISSLEQVTSKPIIPILSSYSEKCSLDSENTACYYKLDIPIDAKNNMPQFAYFYIPETEEAIISIKALEYSEDLSKPDSVKEFDKVSNNDVKRSNWYEYKIENNIETLLIKISLRKPLKMNLTLYSSLSNKPNIVTLNYGEKRIFTIDKNENIKDINSMYFHINKNSNKYRINLHAVRGNGIFTTKGEKYPLGLDASYKEDISIIVDSNSKNLELIAKNDKDGIQDQFVFTIDYILTTTDQLFYEIHQNKKNSFKFYKDSNLAKITFYMKANKTEPEGTEYKNVEMNIKIYSNEVKYDIKSYIVDEDFIENITINVKKNELSSPVGTVKKYIDGGNSNNGFTFLKLEILSKDINNNKADGKDVYIYLIFTPSDRNSKKVKIDLYPYEMPYTLPYNLPLISNELFVEKIQANTVYTLLFSKLENLTENVSDIRIDFVRPLYNDYDVSFEHDLNDNKNPKIENETNLVINNEEEPDQYYFGKQQIYLRPMLQKLYYILFNIKTGNKLDTYIFNFKYQKNEQEELFTTNDNNFIIEGTTEDVTLKVDAINPKRNNGKVVLIFSAYKKDDIKIEKPDLDYLSLNLLFNDFKPKYTYYEEYTKDTTLSKREIKINDMKESGDYYCTCVCIVIDNEREEYFGYRAKSFYLEESNFFRYLLNYMKNNLFVTVLIIIIILFILAIMCKACRAGRKRRRRRREVAAENNEENEEGLIN